MKDYILDHDWGSYNSDKTVNKLMLRNEYDFQKYFDMNIKQMFDATVTDDYKIIFFDGEIYQIQIIKSENIQ